MAELTTEIHIPASPDARYANMLFFLVHSLASNAAFPGQWKVVITLGRDGDLNPNSPEFAWAKNFPVEFQMTEPALWERYMAEAEVKKQPVLIYFATGEQQFRYDFNSDVVLFMDADTIVLRPLAPIIAEVHSRNCLAAKPAWQPPPVELKDIITARGLGLHGPQVTYSGYGFQFVEPRYAPPYFNFGFLAASGQVANIIRCELPEESAFVGSKWANWYSWQIALCLTIIRHELSFIELDERYNYGIGDTTETWTSLLPGDEGLAQERLWLEQSQNVHVLHYGTRTPHFVRHEVMQDDERIRDFCARKDLTVGEQKLQDAFRQFIEEWEQCRAPFSSARPAN